MSKAQSVRELNPLHLIESQVYYRYTNGPCATSPGFEPRPTGSEPLMLPVHQEVWSGVTGNRTLTCCLQSSRASVTPKPQSLATGTRTLFTRVTAWCFTA